MGLPFMSRSLAFVGTLVPLVLLAGCNRFAAETGGRPSGVEMSLPAGISATPLLVPGKNGPAIQGSQLFTRLTPDKTGIDFINPIDTSHPMKFLYSSSMACGGVAIGDVNGDGRPDIFLTSGPKPNRLYLQSGDWKFEDVTERAGVGGGEAWGVGAAIVDVDGDGDLDIYVCNYRSPNQLYVNDGKGTFVDRAKDFGLDINDASHTPAFCDYDADGDLDLYLLTNRMYRREGEPKLTDAFVTDVAGRFVRDSDGRPVVRDAFKPYYDAVQAGENTYNLDAVGRPDYLLRNDGKSAFTDVTRDAGIAGRGHGLSATWWDYDQDGWTDLYVGNDFDEPDSLYRNRGDGTFVEVIKQTVSHTSWFSMGADFGDLNNDGHADFLIADMAGTSHYKQKTAMGSMGDKYWFMQHADPPQLMRNMLYLGTGSSRFMEAANLAGLAKSDWTWAVKLCDLDNDGRLDVYITNGMTRNFNEKDDPIALQKRPGATQWDRYEHLPPMKERNLAYRNLGDLKFQDVAQDWGLDHLGMSFAAAHADLDRDGDLDLIVANVDEPVGMWRNDSATGHRVLLKFAGARGNTQGLGTKVRLRSKSDEQIGELALARGYMSANEAVLHFGLGEDDRIERLEVAWPSGHKQTFDDLAVDRLYTIAEPAGDPPPRNSPQAAPTLFAEAQALSELVHEEQPYDDFAREPLLPNKLSQLGPGMAWGDVDGDGDDDLFVGGAAGKPGRLAINYGNGQFRATSTQATDDADGAPWLADRDCEDMAPLFFDADGDGDLDLYVASGGVECDPQSEVLRDRLYLNDGKGRFARAPDGTLPDLRDSGGVVCAADWDRDGDLDLFVGGRVIPGKYPLPARSRLLRNDGGKFIDATDDVAKSLAESGLVTAAVWSDADGDGWLDLLVAHEWGPVKLFQNDRGQQLVDRTQEAGLADYSGWFNGLAARDLDNDGDIDYVATNFGLNTKYHASREKPALLYYGDFENNGKMHLVEAEYEGKTLFPVRGRGCSSASMPFIKEKFGNYHEFAVASLQDIYTPDCLEKAHRFAATALESAVLINEGGRFKWSALPRLAQTSPSFGLAITEVDGDAKPDIYLAQNFFHPQIETGRMGGGLSMLLRGRGDGEFDPVLAAQSGLVAPGDSKSLTTADVNGDGLLDFVVGVNDGPVQVFERRPLASNRIVAVRLSGIGANPTAVGARVAVHVDDGSRQTAEIQAGSGYLSQSSATLAFGAPQGRRVAKVDVAWPDGSRSSTTPKPDETLISIEQQLK
ncbi:MAG: RNA-binding protein [Planctomycetota bacterium]|nr:MAG: RNA-binding protein [Planctomycetota bacterium]